MVSLYSSLWSSWDIYCRPQIKAVSSLFQLIYILLLCWQNRYTLPSHKVTGSLQIQCRICWYSYSTGILNYTCTLELSRKFFKKHQFSFPSPVNASRITTSETKCPNTDRKFPGESGVSSLLRTFIILLKKLKSVVTQITMEHMVMVFWTHSVMSRKSHEP